MEGKDGRGGWEGRGGSSTEPVNIPTLRDWDDENQTRSIIQVSISRKW